MTESQNRAQTPPTPEPDRRGLGVPQGPRFQLPPTPLPRAASGPPPPPSGRRPSLLTTALAAGGVVLIAAAALAGGVLFLRSVGSSGPSPTVAPSVPSVSAPTPKPPNYAWLPKLSRSQVTAPLLQTGYACEQQPLAGLPGLSAISCERVTTPPFTCEIFMRARDEYHVWEVSARYFDQDQTQVPDAPGTQSCTELGVRLALQHVPSQQAPVMAFLNANRGQDQAGTSVGSLQVWAEDDEFSRFSDITAGYR